MNKNLSLKNFIWFEQTLAQTDDPRQERLEYIKTAIERVFLKLDGLESLHDLRQKNKKDYEFSFVYHDDLIIEFIFHFRNKSPDFFISSYPKTKNEELYRRMFDIGFYDDDETLILEPGKEENLIEQLVAFMTKSIKTNIDIYESLEDNQINFIDEFVKTYKEAFAAKYIMVFEDVVISKSKKEIGVFPFSFMASYQYLDNIEIFGTIETKTPRIEVSVFVPGSGRFTVTNHVYFAKFENRMDKFLGWIAEQTQTTINRAMSEEYRVRYPR